MQATSTKAGERVLTLAGSIVSTDSGSYEEDGDELADEEDEDLQNMEGISISKRNIFYSVTTIYQISGGLKLSILSNYLTSIYIFTW